MYTVHKMLSGKADPLPGYFDRIQSGTGLFLGIFLCLHVFFVSSILMGPQAMWRVSRFFEGYYFFGQVHPSFVAILTAVVSMAFVTHAVTVLGKVPANPRQWRIFWNHARTLRHEETTLWMVQIFTGFLLLFLGSVHLYAILTHPAQIGPFESSDRIWSGGFLPLEMLLLLAVIPHACIGLYRLAMKWLCMSTSARIRLRWIMWGVGSLLLFLALSSLSVYIRLGIEHAPYAGRSY